ncbi:MAG: LamG domain-containing protein, partial [Rivularia sp. (in: cyanobacteria)]
MTTNKPEINISNYTPVIYETAVDFGNAASFDGVNDYVDLGSPSQLQITGNQTIEMWIKPAHFDSRQNPYAKAYGGEGSITMEENGSLSYYYGNRGSNSGSNNVSYQRIRTVAGVLEIDKWSHIAIIRDFDSGKIAWYINGEETEIRDSSVPIFSAAVAGTNSAYIGDGYTNNFEGEIDEVRIWNTARTQ